MTDGVTIYLSEPDEAIERLARLDSARRPSGPVLVAAVAGEPVAALPLDGGPAIADPFQQTAALVSAARTACRANARSPEPRAPCPLDRCAASRRTRIRRAGGARLSPKPPRESNSRRLAMSEANQHSRTASLYASPAGGAAGAAGGVPLPRVPARGHGGRRARLPRRRRRRGRPGRARDADAQRRRRAASLRLEPLQLGVSRAGSLAPDRAGLSLVADPRPQRRRRPAAASDREGDRAGGARREDGLHAARTPSTACRATTSWSACSATPRATAPAASRSSTRRRSRSRAAGRTAARRPPLNYDFWYQPRKNVLISSEFGEPNAYEKGFDIEDVGAGRYGQRLHFWDLAERRLEQTIDLGEQGLVPLEVRWLHDPEAEQRLRRRDPVEQHLPLPPLERQLPGRARDRGRQRGARGLAAARRRARA